MRIALLILALLLSAACNSPAPEPVAGPGLPETFPHSMKGYVLYGYVKDDQTYFTLATGTNRLKTFEELDDADPVVGDDGQVRVRVAGVENAAGLLDRVPPGELTFVATIRHVSVAQTTVPDGVSAPDEATLTALRAPR